MSALSEQELLLLKAELKEKDEIIEILTGQLNGLRTIHHSIKRRLDALAGYITKRALNAYYNGENDEASSEFFSAMGGIQELTSEFELETSGLNLSRILPKTGIFLLDIMFEYFSGICEKRNIEFTLNIRCNIGEAIKGKITSNRFQVLASNHIQNAIDSIEDAMGKEPDSQHYLTVNIGVAGGVFSFSVLDSGAAFDVETLMTIGKKRITTRKEDGHGNGFMDSFVIIKKSNASLIIHETKPNWNFNKSVSINFNERSEFIIKTYRPNDFRKDKRYTIVSN